MTLTAPALSLAVYQWLGGPAGLEPTQAGIVSLSNRAWVPFQTWPEAGPQLEPWHCTLLYHSYNMIWQLNCQWYLRLCYDWDITLRLCFITLWITLWFYESVTMISWLLFALRLRLAVMWCHYDDHICLISCNPSQKPIIPNANPKAYPKWCVECKI